MAFHFKKAESPAKGVRRVCRERIRVALCRLRASGRPAAVHGVRKDIKKLRAIFRLVRGEIGRDVYRRGAKALRAAAGSLNAPRDARATLKAFGKLTGHFAGRFSEIEKALHKHCRKEARRFQRHDSVARADRILRKTNRRVGDLKIEATGWAAIEPGLRKSYRHGREACRLARRKPSPENFHEWRKHVKDLWCYLRLLNPAWPPKMHVMLDELELLGEQLGDDHDLFMLKQFVAENCAGQVREAEALGRLIESRQKKLRSAALKLGFRLYAAAPADICARLENSWNAWHKAG